MAIVRNLGCGVWRRSKRSWSVVEGLLLAKKLYIKGSPFTRELICGFNIARQHLNFMLGVTMLPRSFFVDKILMFFMLLISYRLIRLLDCANC